MENIMITGGFITALLCGAIGGIVSFLISFIGRGFAEQGYTGHTHQKSLVGWNSVSLIAVTTLWGIVLLLVFGGGWQGVVSLFFTAEFLSVIVVSTTHAGAVGFVGQAAVNGLCHVGLYRRLGEVLTGIGIGVGSLFGPLYFLAES
jgi:hypothetical protein